MAFILCYQSAVSSPMTSSNGFQWQMLPNCPCALATAVLSLPTLNIYILTLDWISIHHSRRHSLHKLNWSARNRPEVNLIELMSLFTYNLLGMTARKHCPLFFYCFKHGLLPSNGCRCHNILTQNVQFTSGRYLVSILPGNSVSDRLFIMGFISFSMQMPWEYFRIGQNNYVPNPNITT